MPPREEPPSHQTFYRRSVCIDIYVSLSICEKFGKHPSASLLSSPQTSRSVVPRQSASPQSIYIYLSLSLSLCTYGFFLLLLLLTSSSSSPTHADRRRKRHSRAGVCVKQIEGPGHSIEPAFSSSFSSFSFLFLLTEKEKSNWGQTLLPHL